MRGMVAGSALGVTQGTPPFHAMRAGTKPGSPCSFKGHVGSLAAKNALALAALPADNRPRYGFVSGLPSDTGPVWHMICFFR